jgi:hypothetical protein
VRCRSSKSNPFQGNARASAQVTQRANVRSKPLAVAVGLGVRCACLNSVWRSFVSGSRYRAGQAKLQQPALGKDAHPSV